MSDLFQNTLDVVWLIFSRFNSNVGTFVMSRVMKVTDEKASMAETDLPGGFFGAQAGLSVMSFDNPLHHVGGKTVLGRLGPRRNQ